MYISLPCLQKTQKKQVVHFKRFFNFISIDGKGQRELHMPSFTNLVLLTVNSEIFERILLFEYRKEVGNPQLGHDLSTSVNGRLF